MYKLKIVYVIIHFAFYSLVLILNKFNLINQHCNSCFSLLSADFVAATVLITFGALLGKTSPMQLILLVMIEIPIFVINEIVGRHYFGVRIIF